MAGFNCVARAPRRLSFSHGGFNLHNGRGANEWRNPKMTEAVGVVTWCVLW